MTMPSHYQIPTTYLPHPDAPLPTYYVDITPHGFHGAEQRVVSALTAKFPHLAPHEVEMVDGAPIMHITVTAPHDADLDVLMEYVNDDYPGIAMWEVISIRDEQDNEQLVRSNEA